MEAQHSDNFRLSLCVEGCDVLDNFVATRTIGSDRLFHSRAFILGFGDKAHGRGWRDVEAGMGPSKTLRSAQLAYERGRQFNIIWGSRPFSVPKMIAKLKDVGPKGSSIIT